jgi:DNA-binding GntR family transcriptional regulator
LSTVDEGNDVQLPEASPLSRQVRELLEELIITRQLAPGAKLTETGLSSELGVSRGPLREAIRVLEGSGWVEVIPNQGARVRVPTPGEVLDFFEVFEHLEREAASRAARLISDEGLAHVESVYEIGLHAVEARDVQAVDLANAQFHDAVREQCGNQEYVRLLADLSKRARWYFRSVAVPRIEESWEEHAELVEALRERDPDHAESVIRRHVQGTAHAVNAAASPATQDVTESAGP